MKIKHLVALFLLSVVAIAEPVSAQNIGQSYTCKNKKIYKSNKEVKLGTAKEAIQKKIDAVKGSSAKAKTKRTELKTVKSNLTKCTKGTLTVGGGGGGSGPIPEILGTYTGILTKISNNGVSGCQDAESTPWNFRIKKSEKGVVFITSYPFYGDFLGSAIAGGFHYVSDPAASVSRVETVTGTNLTQTSVSIHLVEEIIRTLRHKVECQSIFDGVFTRDPTPPDF